MNTHQLATRGRLARLACLAGIATAASLAVAAQATASRSVTLKENAYLHSMRREGSVLYEQGNEYGTFDSPLTLKLNVGTTTSTLTFTSSPRGGTISGDGRANFYASGVIAHFSGTLWITQGTGAFAHASAPSLTITGTLQRKTYVVTASFSGVMHY